MYRLCVYTDTDTHTHIHGTDCINSINKYMHGSTHAGIQNYIFAYLIIHLIAQFHNFIVS